LSGGPTYLLVADKASKTFSADGGTKSLQFRAGALGHQLHPSVRQIADRARDLKPRRDRFGRVTKPHALHAA